MTFVVHIMSLMFFLVIMPVFSVCRAQTALQTLGEQVYVKVSDSAVSQDRPWEPEDIRNFKHPEPRIPNPGSVFSDVAVDLIGFYQSSIGPKSIQRCPFYISCSNFALQAIRRYGFYKGICLFIDRNLYRENPGILNHYDLIRMPSGVLKLDDEKYLTGVE